MTETVLVIGASNGQVPILEYCKSLGCKIIVASIKGDYPGFAYADKIYYLDVRDKEAIWDAVKDDKVTAVVSDQLDIAVPSVAYVAEKLGLKSIGYDCALKFQNKYIMRSEAEKIGINVPQYFEAQTVEQAQNYAAELGFPLMIKPVDSQGSWGVTKIENASELKTEFAKSLEYSKSKKIIIEEFISGDEYIVDAFSHDYQCHNLVIGKSRYFNLPNICIPKDRIFKSADLANELEQRILHIHQKLVEGFGLNFGITHGEYLYDKAKDKIYLCEVAARGGGVNISSDIIPLASGVHPDRLLVNYLIGKFDKKLLKVSSGYAGYLCFTLPEGKIESFTGLKEIEEMPQVKLVNIGNIEIGKQTKALNNKACRYGPIVFAAKSYQESLEIIDKIKQTLIIRVKNDQQKIQNIIWE